MSGRTRRGGGLVGVLVALAVGGAATAGDYPLVIKSAVVKKTKANGYGWDVIGSPDPYVKATVKNGKTAQTRNLSDTYEPEWNEEVLTVSVGDEVTLAMWDKDISYDDVIGEYKFTVTKEMAKGEEVLVGFDQVQSLRFRVGGGAAPAEDPALAAARKFLEGEQKVITAAMHPTSSVDKVTFDAVDARKDGITILVTYRFSHLLQTEFTSQMEFTFNAKGKFTGVSAKKSSAYVAPFVGSDIALKVVKEAVAAETGLASSPAMKKALDSADARTILHLYLLFRAGDK